MNHINFTVTPSIGTVLMLGSQEYELVETKPHRRLDGSATTILIWRTACPVCAVEFNVTSGLVANALNRRCPRHHTPLRPVSGRRRKVVAKVIAP